MKNQWPFWLFIIAILVVVVIAMNYQGKQDVAPFGDIFTQDQGALEYEYVAQPDQKAAVPAAATAAVETTAVVKSQTPVSTPEAQPVPAPAAVPVQTPAPVQTSSAVSAPAPAAGSFTVQILSSKDQKATDSELQKVKANGFAEAYVRRVDLGGRGIWYRIYIGQYSSMAQAQEGLVKVKQKYPQAFIFKF